MKYLGHVAFALLLLMTIGYAQANKPPSNCKMVVLSDPLILKTKVPTIFLIHNVSKNDLWITHPVPTTGVSAGWTSPLAAGKWSALAVRDTSFELSCTESMPGHEQQISCSRAIAVCQWHKIPDTKSSGTFWAAENMKLPDVIAQLKERGFVAKNNSGAL